MTNDTDAAVMTSRHGLRATRDVAALARCEATLNDVIMRLLVMPTCVSRPDATELVEAALPAVNECLQVLGADTMVEPEWGSPDASDLHAIMDHQAWACAYWDMANYACDQAQASMYTGTDEGARVALFLAAVSLQKCAAQLLHSLSIVRLQKTRRHSDER